MYSGIVSSKFKYLDMGKMFNQVSYSPVVWNSIANKEGVVLDEAQEALVKLEELILNELNSTPNVTGENSTEIKLATFGTEKRTFNLLVKKIKAIASNGTELNSAIALLLSNMLKNFDLSLIQNSTNSLVSDDNAVTFSPSANITNASTFLDAVLEAKNKIADITDINENVNVYMSKKYFKFYQDSLKGSISSFENGEFSRFGLTPVAVSNSVSDRLVIASPAEMKLVYAYTPSVYLDGVNSENEYTFANVRVSNVALIANKKHIQRIIG